MRTAPYIPLTIGDALSAGGESGGRGFPLINNFEPVRKEWLSNIGDFLMNPAARQNFRSQLLLYLSSDHFKGAALDFEEIPLKAQPGFLALVQELGQDLHARGLRLYLNVPVADKDYDYARLAASADGLVIMNYDQHQVTSAPGPVAAQDWFTANLKQAIKDIPKTKIICAIGGYGYDWGVSPKTKRVVNVDTNSAQEAWLHARESGSEIELDPDSLNPHFAYEEENGVRHQVWYLDAVTALNQMRAARDCRHPHVCAVAAWIGRPLVMENLGQSHRSRRRSEAQGRSLR